ncbi:MAG: hypothetical protein PUB28_09770 [Roseburia sp.]|uniref:hypothetical protein n=1 Tax=Roseburia sp. 831b TaxID=1261635 RepID=UPI0013564EBA|nr:hypothetical protein [Roseburia sp. 831b]MDD6217010.1 hypothetical protein [Roseburia sp.]MDY5884106.1 hypothetical protein [Roseburia sp.]WVK71843.1 hypothetical protein BIV16_08530 [Roseburia sp. 831b]
MKYYKKLVTSLIIILFVSYMPTVASMHNSSQSSTASFSTIMPYNNVFEDDKE